MNMLSSPIASLENCAGFVEIKNFLETHCDVNSAMIPDLRKNVLLAAMSSQTCNEWESVSQMLDQCRCMSLQRGGFILYYFVRKEHRITEIHPLVVVTETGLTQKVNTPSNRRHVTSLFYFLKGKRGDLDMVVRTGMVIELMAIYRDGHNGDIHEN